MKPVIVVIALLACLVASVLGQVEEPGAGFLPGQPAAFLPQSDQVSLHQEPEGEESGEFREYL
jgi:hypothetical protein